MSYASSSRLSADLGRACVEKEGADVFLVARDRSRFPAHKAVVASRSRVLGALLAGAGGDGAGGGEDVAGGKERFHLFIIIFIIILLRLI